MSFGKSKVERFNYYPKTSSFTSGSSQTAGTKRSLSDSLPPCSSLSVSRTYSHLTTPNRSGVMNNQFKEGNVLKRDGFKCHSTGTKKKPISRRIPTTPMVLSRSSTVMFSKQRCSPSLRLGRLSGNTPSRKSEAWNNKNAPIKLKTPKTNVENPDYRSEKSMILPSRLDIFQTPPSTPQAFEIENQIETGNLATDMDQAFQEEGEIQPESNFDFDTPINQSLSISHSSSFYSPPAHESTVIIKNANTSVFSDDASVSVTTPGRTPRRLTDRHSFSRTLENTSLNHSNAAPSPVLARRSLGSSIASIEGTGIRSIVAEKRYSLPTLNNSQPRVNGRRLTSGLDKSSIAQVPSPGVSPVPYPATLMPFRDEEPIQLPTTSNVERSWPSWHLPDPIPPPMLLAPFLDQDVHVGKYHRPIVIAASFYNWFTNILLRQGRTNAIERSDKDDVGKLPEHVRESIIARGLERDLALSKTFFVQYVVHTIITTGGLGYQHSPQARGLLTRLKRHGRQVIRKVTFHGIFPIETALKAPEFWRLIGGQVCELLFSAIL